MEIIQKAVSGLLTEFGKVVVGYEDPKRKIIIALFADVHILLESVPGLAKSLLVETLQQTIGESTHHRIQFTADLKPGDIVGYRLFNQGTGGFEISKGPVLLHNFILADEINRAPGKTQGALLSAMQERKVVINDEKFDLKDPFLVLATMNPVEQEGVFPLPEAQLDRFAMKITLNYVSKADEVKMAKNSALLGRNAHMLAKPVLTAAQLVQLRDMIRDQVYVSDALVDYVVTLVRATRPGLEEFIAASRTDTGAALPTLLREMGGASPRAIQTLIKLGMVRAALKGRAYVMPEDVRYFAHDVLRHRITLSEDARWSDGITADSVIDLVIKSVPIVSEKPELYQRAGSGIVKR